MESEANGGVNDAPVGRFLSITVSELGTMAVTDPAPATFPTARRIPVYAFRNGYLEDLHAGKSSDLTADSSLNRITDDEMKRLMIEACEKLEDILKVRDTNPEKYRQLLVSSAIMYCGRWKR